MWGIGPKNMFDIGSGNCISIELTELEQLCVIRTGANETEKKTKIR